MQSLAAQSSCRATLTLCRNICSSHSGTVSWPLWASLGPGQKELLALPRCQSPLADRTNDPGASIGSDEVAPCLNPNRSLGSSGSFDFLHFKGWHAWVLVFLPLVQCSSARPSPTHQRNAAPSTGSRGLRRVAPAPDHLPRAGRKRKPFRS